MKVVTLTPEGLKALGEALRKHREAMGWSQREASRFITLNAKPGLTATALGRIEKGSVEISLETLLMLSQLGYGGMAFTEMVDIATGRRLAMCEKPGHYQAESAMLAV